MKKMMAVCVGVLLMFTALYFVFRETGAEVQSLPTQDGVQILSISRIQKQDGTILNTSISGDEIEEDLAEALLDGLRKSSMTGRPISVPETMDLTESYDHISLWLQKADGETFRINISSEEEDSNVEYDGSYFGINDPAPLLQEVCGLLEGNMS